jgi:hypothetical protein
MKILNPNVIAKGGDAAKAAALDTFLKAQTGKAEITFAEIRAAVPELAEAKDGEIHQAALDLGCKVAP